MLEFESIHKWKTAVLYPRNCLVKFCRINDENPVFIGAFLGYIFLQPLDGRGIRIRTLNDGVRGSQSFFKTAYLSHFSDFASLKNLSEFYFCSARQIRMRNCEPYTEVSKEVLNPHYLLQQGSAPFGDEEYKSSSFNFTNKVSYMAANKYLT